MELRNGMDINFTVNKFDIYACCAKIPDPVVTALGACRVVALCSFVLKITMGSADGVRFGVIFQ